MSVAGTFIQYGCGTCCPADWRNFDVSPILRFKAMPVFGGAIVRRWSRFPPNAEFGDVVRGLPIAERSADAMYCSHVLEHLWKDECEAALANTYKYLKRGGLFRLVVPDLYVLARAFLNSAEPDRGSAFISSLHMTHPRRPTGFVNFLRSNWGRSQHRWMWEYRGLESLLNAAGFASVRQARVGDSRLAAFASVENPSRYEYSVCVEAEK